MENESQLIDLVKSNDSKNVIVATEIMKSFGKTMFEILQFRYKHGSFISESEALDGGILNNCDSLIKCIVCGDNDFERKVIDMIQHKVCEEKTTCKKCKNETYWAYGSWDISGFH